MLWQPYKQAVIRTAVVHVAASMIVGTTSLDKASMKLVPAIFYEKKNTKTRIYAYPITAYSGFFLASIKDF